MTSADSHLETLSLAFFTGTKTGEIQSRLANDVGGVQTVVTTTASTILANVVIFVSTIVAMIILSWQLTIVAVFTVPAFFWLTKAVGDRRRKVSRSTQESLAAMSAISEETLSVSGVLLAKVFGNQGRDIGRYRQENQRLADLEVRQQMIGQGFYAVVQSFLSITPALVYLIAGLLGRTASPSRPEPSWPSPRCRRGCTSRSGSCSRSRWSCAHRWRCSTGSSSTWT
jgi:ATP-binding cassette, subfamily B, bacterial